MKLTFKDTDVCVEALDTRKIQLKRSMGLYSGCAMILGTIIGSGIFVSPKGVLADTGSVGLALIVWTISGVMVLFGALCYAELGTMIPKSGGPFAYIKETFGNLPAFLYIWSISFVVLPTGMAIISLTFAQYTLKPFFMHCESPETARIILATLAIALLSSINAYSVKWANRVQGFFTALKLSALVIIILTGLAVLLKGETGNFHNAFANSKSDAGSISLAFYSGLYAYSGWDSLNFLTEELKSPYKNLPKCIIISMSLVTVVYVLTNISYFAVLGADEVLESDAVAVSFATLKFGVIGWVMPILVAFSTFGSLNGCIMCIGRLFFVGAREGHYLDAMALLNMKTFTPITSIFLLVNIKVNGYYRKMLLPSHLQALVSIGMLFLADIYTLINYCTLVEAFGFGLCALVLLYLRWKHPHMNRPIKVPIFIPISFLLVCVFLVVFPLYSNPKETIMGLVLLLSGLPMYYIGVVWQNKPRYYTATINKFTILMQKLTYACAQDD